MSLDEKLAQIGSCWVYELQQGGVLNADKLREKLSLGIGQITRVGGASTLDPISAAKVGNQIQKFLVEQTRLGIPAILHEESCAGAMILGGSVFPQMIGLASTFMPELAEQMTREIRKQLLAIGARQALAPVLDVSRDVRWGRTEETFGEDPTLVSHFGVAYIRGLQGDHFNEGVMATGKHFIGHSHSQGGLNCGPVHLGKHELYDVLLPPFQAAIRDAGLASIMNAYPELDGEVVAASREILTDLLREKLGFEGLLVSDYDAVLMIHNYHNRAETHAEAGALALKAGINVELPTTVCFGDPLKSALASGDLDLETLDSAVRRHLEKKIELGLFDNPYVNEHAVLDVFETAAQRELAREIARKSMVLLKNDGLLPLQKSIKTLAVIGPNADSGRNQLGDYSYAATFELMTLFKPEGSNFADHDLQEIERHGNKFTSVLEGIKAVVSADTSVLYARGCANNGDDRSGFDAAVNLAKQADAVVLVLGDQSGLTPACTTGEFRDSADLTLPGVQLELAKAIIGIGKPVAVVLINGRPYALPWLDEKANAILEAWLPGEEGGGAVADVLFGEVNPAGKLPLSYPRQVGQLPIFYNHKPSGMKSNIYGDYVSEKATPLYPFGHGLSYTRFEYSDLVIDKASALSGELVHIQFKLKNSGPLFGEEVVQLYTRDQYAKMPRPVKELRGYTRVGLKPGEAKTVIFKLPVNQLAFFDKDLNLGVEAGRILVMIGSSSQDIRLQGDFNIIEDQRIPLSERIFACSVKLEE